MHLRYQAKLIHYINASHYCKPVPVQPFPQAMNSNLSMSVSSHPSISSSAKIAMEAFHHCRFFIKTNAAASHSGCVLTEKVEVCTDFHSSYIHSSLEWGRNFEAREKCFCRWLKCENDSPLETEKNPCCYGERYVPYYCTFAL